MSKGLLYLEDLYDFYSNTYKQSTHFDAKKSGEPIVVQVHGKVNFNKSDKDTEGLCPVHLQACHTNLNLNGSNISESVMTSALPSFSNRPILGYIHKVNDQWEFYSHNMHEDENGGIVYDEKPVGIIPESCNAQLVYDEDKKKTYCEVDGYIFEEYSKAAEILQREEECSVSVELSIRALSYNAKDCYLDIEDFFFSGVTILGKTPDGNAVNPGMEKSNIKLADFSANNNSLFEDYESKMIELQERLEKLETTCFNKEQATVQTQSKEGGMNNKMTKFEELLNKYGKTVEDVTFNYAEMSDEELEEKFAEMFDDDNSGGDNSNDGEDDGEGVSKPNGDESESQNFEKIVRTYEISHEDTRYALYNLLAPYEESDNDYYYISNVFDSYFVYESWCTDKIYRQNYTKDGDNVAFNGERIELFRELLTASEKAELESMRLNYAVLKEFKDTAEKNDIHAQKEAIVNAEKYSILAEKNTEGKYINNDFAELVNNMDNYSVEEFETKIKVLHSDYISTHSNYSSTASANSSPVKMFANINKKSKPKKNYGNLFD
jgi:hypothetical protein